MTGIHSPFWSMVSRVFSPLDLIYPTQRMVLQCRACGDRYQAIYRVGCFGPYDARVELLHNSFLRGNCSGEILCAHCGHTAWKAPKQGLLREAFAEQVRVTEAMNGDFACEMRREAGERLHNWASRLDLEQFERLAPEWFAALWADGPNPSATDNLPKTHSKKLRVFLRKALHKGAVDELPAVPPVDPERLEAWQSRMLGNVGNIALLAEQIKALGEIDFLHFGAFLFSMGKEFGHPTTRPNRGQTDCCYRLEKVDGPTFAEELKGMLEVGNFNRVGEAVIEEGLEIALRDRLDILLSQHGLARGGKG